MKLQHNKEVNKCINKVKLVLFALVIFVFGACQENISKISDKGGNTSILITEKSIASDTTLNALKYKTEDSITTDSICFDTILIGDYVLPRKIIDLIDHKRNDCDFVYPFQKIRQIEYNLGDTVLITTNTDQSYWNFDTIQKEFLFNDGSLGIITYETFTFGTNSMCGGVVYLDIWVHRITENEAKELAHLFDDGCRVNVGINDTVLKEASFKWIAWEVVARTLNVYVDDFHGNKQVKIHFEDDGELERIQFTNTTCSEKKE